MPDAGDPDLVRFRSDRDGLRRDIFERLMPEARRRQDPTRLFHISSPYGGSPTGNWPLEGDWHDYTTINFAPEASVPLFGSEVLRTSVPSLTSMKRFISEDELWPKGFDPAIRKPGQPAWPPACSYHSTGIATWDRVGPVHEYCDPSTAGELIRVLGTAHGEYLRDRVERERRGVPDGGPVGSTGLANRRCWGNLVWRLNDSWPMIYGSMVDYYLEPKIAHYFLRRAYEPVLVSFEKTPDRINVWVINDSPQPVSGMLVVQRLDFAGKVLGELQAEISVKPGEARRCLNTTELGEISLRSQFLHAAFAGQESTCLLIGERYLHLPSARLSASLAGGCMEIGTDAFARQVTLEFTSHGRSLWALGTVLGLSSNEGLRGIAGRLFEHAIPTAVNFISPRSWAFTLLGTHRYLRRYPGDRAVLLVQDKLAQKLKQAFNQNRSEAWPWPENIVTYCNPVLPQALIQYGQATGDEEAAEIGLDSLEWLIKIQRSAKG